MSGPIRYSDYLNASSFRHSTIPYSTISPAVDPATGAKDRRLDISFRQAMALIGPYCSTRIMEQIRAVVPLALYFRGSRVKVQVALARGKKLYDKREAKREKDDRRAIERAMMRRR